MSNEGEEITILGDLNTGVTHVRIRVPIPVIDDETCEKIRAIVWQEVARARVRRTIGL